MWTQKADDEVHRSQTVAQCEVERGVRDRMPGRNPSQRRHTTDRHLILALTLLVGPIHNVEGDLSVGEWTPGPPARCAAARCGMPHRKPGLELGESQSLAGIVIVGVNLVLHHRRGVSCGGWGYGGGLAEGLGGRCGGLAAGLGGRCGGLAAG